MVEHRDVGILRCQSDISEFLTALGFPYHVNIWQQAKNTWRPQRRCGLTISLTASGSCYRLLQHKVAGMVANDNVGAVLGTDVNWQVKAIG